MVEAVVSVLVEKLLESLLKEGGQVLEFHKQFKKMQKELPHMQSFLEVANSVRINDRKGPLKTVARDLTELLYEAEDITEDCELFLRRRQRRRRKYKFMRYFSLSLLRHRYQMGKRLSEINQEIGDLREKIKTYLPSTVSLPSDERARTSRPIRYPIMVNDTEIVGLEDDARKIKQWVMDVSGPMRVIGIVGMGGIGKTTLAQKIMNDLQLKDSFECILHATVSQTIKYDELIKNLLRKLNVDKNLSDIDVGGLLEELHKHLDGSRYLIILDDVWRIDEGSWWESLKSTLSHTNRGGCVIVTTRNEVMARSMGAIEKHIHRPKVLSNGDDWSLFTKIAFANNGGQCPNPKIEHIAKEIVSQCKGLPLAIRVVGGVMLGKGDSVHEWKRISMHLKQTLAVQDELIFSPLHLSYEELPQHLKPCMLYFAAFPEDYEINIVDIVWWWMGEGFVRQRDGKTAQEIGFEYFNELICRSLVIGFEKNVFGERFESCRVHDLVRDMIIKIAKEENFWGLDDRGMLTCTNDSRRLHIENSKIDQINPQLLRTMIGIDMYEEEFASNVGPKLPQLKWLRVLHISFITDNISENVPSKVNWWSEIGSLSHLICLTIVRSCLDELPDSIENLHNLQALILRECDNLKCLPRQVTTLEKLNRLLLIECKKIEYLPKEVRNLANLKVLLGFRPANSNVEDGCHLSDLKTLTLLKELEIIIDSEDQLKEEELKVLSELKQLEELVMQFKTGISEPQIIGKVDYEILPLQKLQILVFVEYPGEATAAWVNPTTLPNLQRLRIINGNISGMSTKFFGVENVVWELENLILNDLPNLKVDWLRMKKAMPFLRQLEVDNCDKLTSPPWSYDDGTWTKEEEHEEEEEEESML